MSSNACTITDAQIGKLRREYIPSRLNCKRIIAELGKELRLSEKRLLGSTSSLCTLKEAVSSKFDFRLVIRFLFLLLLLLLSLPQLPFSSSVAFLLSASSVVAYSVSFLLPVNFVANFYYFHFSPFPIRIFAMSSPPVDVTQVWYIVEQVETTPQVSSSTGENGFGSREGSPSGPSPVGGHHRSSGISPSSSAPAPIKLRFTAVKRPMAALFARNKPR